MKTTDVLIIGSGIAGATAALRLGGSGRHNHHHAPIGQLQCSRRAGNAAAEDEDFGF